MLTRSKAARVSTFIDGLVSPLTDIPSDEEFEVQKQTNNELLAREQQQQQQSKQSASQDTQMANHAYSSPRTPHETIIVRNIEDELSLSPAQSEQLRVLINNEMEKAGILGTITFGSKTKAQHEGALRQVIDAAKQKLTFSGENGLAEERLNKLLMARAPSSPTPPSPALTI